MVETSALLDSGSEVTLSIKGWRKSLNSMEIDLVSH